MARMTNRRIEWLIRQVEGSPRTRETLGQMAARWGVTPRRLRQLRQQWKQTGTFPQLNPRRRPPNPPLTVEQCQQVTEEHARTPRGATKVYLALLREGIHITKMQVYRFMKDQGWIRPNPRKQRRRTRVRYERQHSGSLLHGDYHRTSGAHPHAIPWEDDASRMVLSGGEFPEATTEHAIATLRVAVHRSARWNVSIREVNTDRGCQFFANAAMDRLPGEGAFQRFLVGQGIRHVVSRPHNPQTNGKVESLWLEYDRHRWRLGSLEDFMAWRNRQVHDALWIEQLETPSEAWQRKVPIENQLGLFWKTIEKEGARNGFK
jgi:transposase InsO family protein